MPTIRGHQVTLEKREGVRGPYPAPSYRWACSCGLIGRWTRQDDTAEEGQRRHHLTHETAGGNR